MLVGCLSFVLPAKKGPGTCHVCNIAEHDRGASLLVHTISTSLLPYTVRKVLQACKQQGVVCNQASPPTLQGHKHRHSVHVSMLAATAGYDGSQTYTSTRESGYQPPVCDQHVLHLVHLGQHFP